MQIKRKSFPSWKHKFFSDTYKNSYNLNSLLCEILVLELINVKKLKESFTRSWNKAFYSFKELIRQTEWED